MRLSIIIPCHNEAAMLPETLRCVEICRAALTSAGIESELIVVNNNCTDETGGIALAAGAAIAYESQHQTAAAARNRGTGITWTEQPGDWLLFLDADTSPTPELFQELITALRSDRFDAGSCLVRGETPNLGHALWNTLAIRRKRLCGAFLFVRAATFHRLGGFNPKTKHGEELEFAKMLPPGRVAILTGNPLLLRPRKPAFKVA